MRGETKEKLSQPKRRYDRPRGRRSPSKKNSSLPRWRCTPGFARKNGCALRLVGKVGVSNCQAPPRRSPGTRRVISPVMRLLDSNSSFRQPVATSSTQPSQVISVVHWLLRIFCTSVGPRTVQPKATKICFPIAHKSSTQSEQHRVAVPQGGSRGGPRGSGRPWGCLHPLRCLHPLVRRWVADVYEGG